MKRLFIKGGGKIEVEDVPGPKPGEGEVLIRTLVSALCGSELGGYRKDGLPAGNNGHEAVGVVEELGRGVTSLKVGQRVGVSAIVGCGTCGYCRQGQFTWCDTFRFFGNMHAEYFVVPALGCHAFPADVDTDAGVLLAGDGLGVPFHTSTKMDGEVQTVAVFGLGPIGLGNIMLQSHMGRRVIGIDRSPERLALAEKMGAAEVILADGATDVVAAIRAKTDGRGVDVSIEAAGHPTTAQQCFSAVRTAGLVVFNGEQPSIELSPSDDFIRRDVKAVGAWFYHFSEFPAMLDLYRGGLPVRSLITHSYKLEEADEAYWTMANGKSGKILFRY